MTTSSSSRCACHSHCIFSHASVTRLTSRTPYFLCFIYSKGRFPFSLHYVAKPVHLVNSISHSQNIATMADFSSSSSPYESEVDQILAEAMDHCVLEQISAINCSSFSHSLLPSHLETRFQKLKTFPPSSSSKLQLAPKTDGDDKVENLKLPSGQSKVSNFEGNSDVGEGKMGKSPNGQLKFPNFEGGSGGRKGKMGNSKGGYVSSPSDSSSGYMDSPNLKSGKHDVKGKMGNSKPKSLSFCSDSEEETAAKSGGGCLCFSPKRVSNKKKKGGSGGGDELGFGWGKDEELLSDLRSFSSKEQKRRMKEAMREEEKINKEAEKIVKWAKQVSARMDFDISDDGEDDIVDDHSGHRRHSGRR
ncbi:uncharacterized protein LOC141587005 [Silene latifolia]|uniref:uncharacterized protein LOC141587005 n=1 Tax=Silene latifolia TaxID=37657 RepID=UPI003D76C954